jgi:hypothetical protein
MAAPIALILATGVLTGIAGEAGGDRIVAWLSTLAVMTLVWLASLGTKPVSPWLLMGVAVGMRGILLMMPAGWDTYRYVWEGNVLAHGFNPYLHPPDSVLLESLRDQAWHSIGLRGATAIYPPVAQWLFAGLASPGLEVHGFKLVFTLADVALCWILLNRFGSRAARIYAWNPLAALSFAGGGHYDSLFMLAMVLAWLVHEREQGFPWRSSLWIGLAIGLKWMALPVGLWLVLSSWRRSGFRSALLCGLLVSAPVSLAYAALSVWTGEWTLQLMPPFFSRTARSMEFLPVIIDYCGRAGRLDNRIYLVLLIAVWIVVAGRVRSFTDAAEWSLFATYLFSPMLHAWYLVWALPFAVKSGNPGIIGLAATGIFYYVVHYNMDHLGLGWTYTWWQRAVIWLPFAVGFLIAKNSFKKPSTP